MMRGFQTILQSSLGKPWISGKPWHIQRRDGLGFGWDGLNLPSLKIHSQCYKFHASTMFNWFIQIPGDFFRSYGRKITIFDVLKNHHVYIYIYVYHLFLWAVFHVSMFNNHWLSPLVHHSKGAGWASAGATMMLPCWSTSCWSRNALTFWRVDLCLISVSPDLSIVPFFKKSGANHLLTTLQISHEYEHDQPDVQSHANHLRKTCPTRLPLGPRLEDVVAPQQPHFDQTVEVVVWIRDTVVALRFHPTGPVDSSGREA